MDKIFKIFRIAGLIVLGLTEATVLTLALIYILK